MNDMYVEYESDWLATICAATSSDAVPAACEGAMDLRDLGTTGVATVAHESLAKYISADDPGKVDVYIVAEAL